MSFTQKYSRRQLQSILAAGQGDELYDILEAMENRIEALVSLVNSKVAAGTPSAAVAHEVPDFANKLDAEDPIDLPTAVLFANALKAKYSLHIADAAGVGTGAHQGADATNVITAADATYTAGNELVDVPALIALVTDLQTNYEAHIAVTPAVHAAADAANGLDSAVPPTTVGECITILSDIKAKFNAHIDLADGISTGVGSYESRLV